MEFDTMRNCCSSNSHGPSFCQLQFCSQANTKLNKCEEWLLIVAGMENRCLDSYPMGGFFSFSENILIIYCVQQRAELGLSQPLWLETNIWAEWKLVSSSSEFSFYPLHFPISLVHMLLYHTACVCYLQYSYFYILNYISLNLNIS